MVSTQKSAQLGRRSVVRGAAWAVPAVGIGAAALAIAASPVNTPIYRNSYSGISYAYTSACQVSYTINALTTTTDPNAANGYWLESDVATVGAVSNLKYSVTTTQCGLTWTVTQVSGVGGGAMTWKYDGVTTSGGQCTYTFSYVGPSTMQTNVGTNYAIDIANTSTGFMAVSSSTSNCYAYRAWNTNYTADLWGNSPWAYSETKYA